MSNTFSVPSGESAIRGSDVIVRNALKTYWFAAKAVSSGVLGAGGSVRIFDLFHGVTAANRVRLLKLAVSVEAVSALATFLTFELVRFDSTTLPAGGTTMAFLASDPADPAAELSGLVAPTTPGGAENAVPLGTMRLGYGVIAPSTSELYRYPVVLLEQSLLGNTKPPTIRRGVQEGWGLKLTTSAADTITLTVSGALVED